MKFNPALPVAALAVLSTPATASADEPQATKVWYSGFEQGWPGGEYLEYYPSQPGETDTSGWAILDAEQAAAEGVTVPEGRHIYKGWINKTLDKSHRAYPVVHFDRASGGTNADFPEGVPSPFVTRFYVWLDWPGDEVHEFAWMHFLTLSNTTRWNVVTLSTLGNGQVVPAHVGPWSPEAFEAGNGMTAVGDGWLNMPLRQWVRFTVYVDYRDEYDHMYVWKDGELIFKANGGNIDQQSPFLKRAHWGLYASGNVPGGVQYNDAIQIWTLDAPWKDFSKEPPSPWDGEGIDFDAAEPTTKATTGDDVRDD